MVLFEILSAVVAPRNREGSEASPVVVGQQESEAWACDRQRRAERDAGPHRCADRRRRQRRKRKWGASNEKKSRTRRRVSKQTKERRGRGSVQEGNITGGKTNPGVGEGMGGEKIYIYDYNSCKQKDG